MTIVAVRAAAFSAAIVPLTCCETHALAREPAAAAGVGTAIVSTARSASVLFMHGERTHEWLGSPCGGLKAKDHRRIDEAGAEAVHEHVLAALDAAVGDRRIERERNRRR